MQNNTFEQIYTPNKAPVKQDIAGNLSQLTGSGLRYLGFPDNSTKVDENFSNPFYGKDEHVPLTKGLAEAEHLPPLAGLAGSAAAIDPASAPFAGMAGSLAGKLQGEGYADWIKQDPNLYIRSNEIEGARHEDIPTRSNTLQETMHESPAARNAVQTLRATL